MDLSSVALAKEGAFPSPRPLPEGEGGTLGSSVTMCTRRVGSKLAALITRNPRLSQRNVRLNNEPNGLPLLLGEGRGEGRCMCRYNPIYRRISNPLNSKALGVK